LSFQVRHGIVALLAMAPSPAAVRSLADVLLQHGELEPGLCTSLSEEAFELDCALTPELPKNRRLGEFILGREIGRGGMGIVFEARQESLGRRVAVKILPAGAALDDRLAARFLLEARAVARLRHPGIVPVFASGQAEGVLFFAMEKVEGRSLAQVMDGRPLPAKEGRANSRRGGQSTELCR